MRLADVEARDLLVRALLRAAKRIRTTPNMPFEWTEGIVAFLDPEINFRHPQTRAVIYGGVYVLISESAEDIQRLKAALSIYDDGD